jgi:molybdate transport system substrate-binding protein
MKILSTLAVKAVLDELVPDWQAATGTTVNVSIDPTALIVKRINEGERADLAILTADGIQALSAAGILAADSRMELCGSAIGIAVRHGAAKPDIATAVAVRQTLLDAPSLAYSKAGASGIFFAKLIQRLGIADEINRKATIIPSGFTAVLAADSRVALAIQQVSELMAVPGVDIVGPLPDDINERLRFLGAVFVGSTQARAAAEFLLFLSQPGLADVYQRAGLRAVC